MRDGFIIHEKTIRMLDHLDLASKGYLLECLSSFYTNNELDMAEVSDTNPSVAIIMEDAMDRMTADAEAYERAAQQRSEAGKRSALKRWGNGAVTKSNEAITGSNEAITKSNGVITGDNEDITGNNAVIAEENEENEEEKVVPKEEAKEEKEDIYKEKVIAKAITEEKVVPKHRYGEYKHVLLSDKELEKLNADYGIDKTAYAIKWFDAYIEEKGYKCKSYSLAMRRWVFDAIEEQESKKQPVSRSGTLKANWNIEKRDYDMEDLEAQLLRRSL